MSNFGKMGAWAAIALACSLNVSVASANDTSALQSGLEQFNQAVKDSSSLSLYSAVEFTGLDPSTDCFIPDNYDAFPDAPANAEICYQGFLKPDDGTDYIAYTQETGYTLVFKDNVINHVVIPIGSEGSGFSEKSLKLKVTSGVKTPKTQSLACEDLSGQKARCNGSYVVVAAKESGQDMAQALNALYTAIANISSQSVSDALTQAINEAENASMAALQAQSTADKAITDAAAASSKASSVKSELQGSIANNKSAAASAQQTANAASASVADLSKTVTDNKTATDSALATKVDATYVTTAINNIPEPEVDLSGILQRLDQLEAQNSQLETKNAELAKKVPVASIKFDGFNCVNRICPILSGYGIKKVEQVSGRSFTYNLYFENSLSDNKYSFYGRASWDSEAQGYLVMGYTKYPQTNEYFTIEGGNANWNRQNHLRQSKNIDVVVHKH
jgi:hypothetical protein